MVLGEMGEDSEVMTGSGVVDERKLHRQEEVDVFVRAYIRPCALDKNRPATCETKNPA